MKPALPGGIRSGPSPLPSKIFGDFSKSDIPQIGRYAGDACPLSIHRVSQNHVSFVIIISGRVVGTEAFCRFIIIVSTIIYRAYPPEKRLLE